MNQRRVLRVTVLLIVGPAALASQVSVQAGVHIARAEHRVLDAGALVPTSGTLFAASLALDVRDRFEIRGEALGGHFAATSTPSVDDHDVAELQVLGGVRVRPWLELQAGPVMRSLSSPLGRQHWTIVRVGAEAHIPLALEHVRGLLGGYWMPLVSVSGLRKPDVALSLTAGVQWLGRRVGIGTVYQLERFDFPSNAGAQRLEEFSALQLRITVWTSIRKPVSPS